MNWTYFIFFICIILCTLIITYWAARHTKTTGQFYIAAGSLTGIQNGMAIAGDYISAASFLGIVGMISINGYDGFLYGIGFLVSYLIVLFFIAEPIHRVGGYSLGDVICKRFPDKTVRLLMALGAFVITILYIIPQLVAAGSLIHLLLDVNYTTSVLVIGGLMTIYVVFGGMFATSWVQIVKTVLLLSATFLLTLIVFARFDWDISSMIDQVKAESPLGDAFFNPGNLLDKPFESISLHLALILGTAGLPHILIRFFTVKNVREVRKSLVTSTWIIGIFYLITLILGFGVVRFVGIDRLLAHDPTGNLAALLLAKEAGGDFLLAFISAVAFTTIIAVVAGLVISATISFSHDVFFHIIKNKQTTEREQINAARWSAFVIGLVATLFALGLENINVTFLVSLTFIVAASSNLPVLLFTFYWERFNRTGLIVGMVSGLVMSLLLMIGPNIMNMTDGWIRHEPLITLKNPGIIAIPFGFLAAILATYLAKSREEDVVIYKEFRLLAFLGIDVRGDHDE